jgi:hypothetical protein
MRIPATSAEYVPIPVRFDGAIPVTVESVQVALIDPDKDEPEALDWKNGLWDPDGWALLLIGPGTPTGQFAPGKYAAWVRVAASPETVVRLSGAVVIF